MAKTFKIVTIEHKEVDQWTCDICKKPMPTGSSYHSDEVTVERVESTHFPDDAYGDSWSFDVCPECWKSTVYPFMVERTGIDGHLDW